MKINGGVFERYYGFEPDSYNFQLLNKFIDGLPLDIRKRSEIFKLPFMTNAEQKLFILSKVREALWRILERKCQYNNDRQGVGRKKSYIYQDEYRGSEIKALKGAENTIKNFRPLIAAAGYHKTRDLWEVPMIIKSFNPDYRFNLRSYMNHLSFIYYCS